MSVEAIQAQLLYDPFWQEIRDSVSPVSQGKGAPTASDLNSDAAEAQCSLRGKTTCTCYVDSFVRGTQAQVPRARRGNGRCSSRASSTNYYTIVLLTPRFFSVQVRTYSI